MKKGDLRLTEKKMLDCRFRRTEEAIFEAFSRGEPRSTCRVISRARISRSTFYHHHKGAIWILPDYRGYILRKYTRMINRLLKRRGLGMKTIYFRLIMFILREKQTFLMFLEMGERGILDEMVLKLGPRIRKAAKISGIYQAEVVVLIEEWERRGFREEEIDGLLANIMFLTETAWVRLGAGIK
ncbi:MAG: hypothetical protein Q4B65_01645 [Candidatus Saccharibacteria bacterium]|nr:hypothetical protein [Candidatus Saccharibacteria bacterium]